MMLSSQFDKFLRFPGVVKQIDEQHIDRSPATFAISAVYRSPGSCSALPVGQMRPLQIFKRDW